MNKKQGTDRFRFYLPFCSITEKGCRRDSCKQCEVPKDEDWSKPINANIVGKHFKSKETERQEIKG